MQMRHDTGFERLRIYQLALEGNKLIYLLTKDNLLKRDFSLVDQIRRASMSVCANIAEGYGRHTKRDFAQFMSVAIGSINEVVAFLDIINSIYPSIDTNKERIFYIELGKQAWSFRRSLNKGD